MLLSSQTPYPAINALLETLLASLQAVLGERLTGIYLHGSLASGDFHPNRSDVDILVVTASELPGETLVNLQAMHGRIAASGLEWATTLEISYIPQKALRRYDPDNAYHPALRADGSFSVDRHGSDWVIQRHNFRENGIVLSGPDIKTLIDPVQPEELKEAVAGILEEWWRPKLKDFSLLTSGEYQAFAVLTMCRALYTLQTGEVVSKPAAARWAQETLGQPWAPLIERASAWQRGQPLDVLGEILDFIRYTLEKSSRSGDR